MTTDTQQKPGNQGHGHGHGHGQDRKDLHVKVIYASAAHPYNDPHADPKTTVGSLKATVLAFFGLVEGNRPDGSSVTYTLFHKKQPLENMNQQLDSVDPHDDKLNLKLGEQIVQGDDQRPVTASEIAFEDDLRQMAELEEAGRWKLERGARQELFVTIRSATDVTNSYEVRLAWQNYPLDAPSLKFRNPQTKSLSDPTAWPVVRGFRPVNLDACVNWCAEGFNTHPEWRNDAKYRWRSEGNALLRVLRILQSEMDDYYSGRHK